MMGISFDLFTFLYASQSRTDTGSQLHGAYAGKAHSRVLPSCDQQQSVSSVRVSPARSLHFSADTVSHVYVLHSFIVSVYDVFDWCLYTYMKAVLCMLCWISYTNDVFVVAQTSGLRTAVEIQHHNESGIDSDIDERSRASVPNVDAVSHEHGMISCRI